MNAPEKGLFSVLNFSLVQQDDGRPTQRTATCGTFLQVERAFELAREEAVREVSRRLAAPQEPATLIELLDTEWGYDVRQNLLVVSRYWVHDRTPSVLTP
jgi:hypothetical protein